MLTAICDYSAVLAGAKKLQTGIKLGVKTAFSSLVYEGTAEAIKNLLLSYEDTPGRPEWTRTGKLERAVFTSVNSGTPTTLGWLAGIGDIEQLYSMAPYWNMVEEGSSEYVGETREGYWADRTGKPWGMGSERFPGTPTQERYPVDRWIDATGIEMTIGTPIKAHNFYKNTSDSMRKVFLSQVAVFVKGAI